MKKNIKQLTDNYINDNKFLNPTWNCSVFCETSQQTKQMYITGQSRYEVYEELCRLYPVAKGGQLLYSKRTVIERV